MNDKRAAGRPAVYGTPATERINIRVTPAQHTELRRAADASGTGISSVVRELIDERVEDGRRPLPGSGRHDDDD